MQHPSLPGLGMRSSSVINITYLHWGRSAWHQGPGEWIVWGCVPERLLVILIIIIIAWIWNSSVLAQSFSNLNHPLISVNNYCHTFIPWIQVFTEYLSVTHSAVITMLALSSVLFVNSPIWHTRYVFLRSGILQIHNSLKKVSWVHLRSS